MKLRFVFFGLLLITLSCAQSSKNIDSDETVKLWPEIEPFKTGYLKVSDIHEIYYELSGNPDGQPFFAIHGGPGGSSSASKRRLFNPDKFLIVQYDQRGAGKSRPISELRQNTTQSLVQDIEQLRKHLDLGKILIFGSSWGSTLALAYAETFPESVKGMVLLAVYLATQDEDEYIYQHSSMFYPDAHDEMLSAIPNFEQNLTPSYLFETLQKADSLKRRQYSKAWAKYEWQLAMYGGRKEKEVIEKVFEKLNPYGFTLIESFYLSNGCFLKEGQLLRNTDRIQNIRIIIVNGRYDMICPPITAYRLHKKLPKSKLILVEEAGHLRRDRPIEIALLKSLMEFEQR